MRQEGRDQQSECECVWVCRSDDGNEELRCVLAVVRHGDRTPKQKMKMKVTQVSRCVGTEICSVCSTTSLYWHDTGGSGYSRGCNSMCCGQLGDTVIMRFRGTRVGLVNDG